MHIGLIGLGRMGNNMRARLEKNGIDVTGYDTNPEVSDVATVADLVAALPAPRTIWVMVPAGQITDSVIRELEPLLEKGDLVIDGGNSKFTEDFKHSELLAPRGVDFMDVGVSGGIWGLENGYGLMVGGRPRRSSVSCPSSTRCARRVRATRDSSTSARSAPVTTRRWCTTASSTR